jgi:hypothetical protein
LRSIFTHPPDRTESLTISLNPEGRDDPFVSQQIRRILPGFFLNSPWLTRSAYGSCGPGSPPKKHMQLVFSFTALSKVSTFDHLGERWAFLKDQFWQ